MRTKNLAGKTAKAALWDQCLGWIDRLIFYPLLLWLAADYGWLICFLVTVPCYLLFSLFVVDVHYRYMREQGIDMFGIHTMQEIAKNTKPPKFGKNIILYPWHQIKFGFIALASKQFRVFWHIVHRATHRIWVKIQSRMLNSPWLLYTVGSVCPFDPQMVFMFTQKCETEKELVDKCITRLFPLVCWHIAYYSFAAYLVSKGIVWLWNL